MLATIASYSVHDTDISIASLVLSGAAAVVICKHIVGLLVLRKKY